MRRLAVLFAAVVLTVAGAAVGAVPAGAAPAPGAGSGRTAAYVGELTRDQLSLLVATGIDRRELQAARGAAGKVRVEVVLPDGQARSLIARGVPLAPKQAAAQKRAAPGAAVFRRYSGPGGLGEEYRAVAAKNPGLVKLISIGRTVRGQDIIALKVTQGAGALPDGRRPAVLYVSAQHAREWITPEMTRRLFHHFVDDYARDPQVRAIVDSTELWFVPVANPDGYDYTFDVDRLWRKNLRDNDGDGQITSVDGVDPNRNYPTKWGYDNEGSSPDPASETYRGKAPRSEPETQALDGLMNRLRFKFLVNYHSAAELLLYGIGWQVATPTPDDLIYEAMAGDDAHPAVPGYDPDISAELYTTNGETDDHAQNAYKTLAFTPEMSTCETASAADPNDAFDPADCESVFNFPDSEPLIQAEYAKNVPFAMAVARSAPDPSTPVSVVGRTTPDFAVDSFAVSYGDPQPVAVTARRDIAGLSLNYRIAGGPAQRAPAPEWAGGKRYGDSDDVYYAEFRGTVRGARPGNRVEAWFTGTRQARANAPVRAVESPHFTYTLQRTGGSVLVLSDEDYRGYNPGGPYPGPRYAAGYVAALGGAGRAALWDTTAQGVPHDLGVLSHFRSVVWYLGDNRLTQDQQDVTTDFLGEPLTDAAVSERAQFLTLSVRDYLNGGGKLAHSGETAAYFGTLGRDIGGIYYGLDGAPNADCVVTVDPFSDCLLLADDFAQYYLGAWSRDSHDSPTAVVRPGGPPVGLPLAGTPTNPLNEAGTFLPTSAVLPVAQFPQFRSTVSGVYTGGKPSTQEVFEGSWFAAANHADNSYMRLARTVDLTTVPAAQKPTLQFALSYDTESGFDNVIVEAHPVGTDTWTTLPEVGGHTDPGVPTQCEAGFLLDLHPFLGHYLTRGDPCGARGTTGSWNRFTGSSGGWLQVGFDLSAYAGKQVEVSVSYVTDQNTGGTGVFVDQTRLHVGTADTQPEGFETGLGVWRVPGAPPGSPRNAGDFARQQQRVGAVITTPDTILFGFGLEQVGLPARTALLGSALAEVGASPAPA